MTKITNRPGANRTSGTSSKKSERVSSPSSSSNSRKTSKSEAKPMQNEHHLNEHELTQETFESIMKDLIIDGKPISQKRINLATQILEDKILEAGNPQSKSIWQHILAAFKAFIEIFKTKKPSPAQIVKQSNEVLQNIDQATSMINSQIPKSERKDIKEASCSMIGSVKKTLEKSQPHKKTAKELRAEARAEQKRKDDEAERIRNEKALKALNDPLVEENWENGMKEFEARLAARFAELGIK